MSKQDKQQIALAFGLLIAILGVMVVVALRPSSPSPSGIELERVRVEQPVFEECFVINEQGDMFCTSVEGGQPIKEIEIPADELPQGFTPN